MVAIGAGGALARSTAGLRGFALKALGVGASSPLGAARASFASDAAAPPEKTSFGNLSDEDQITSTHRGHGHLVAKGGDFNQVLPVMAKAVR